MCLPLSGFCKQAGRGLEIVQFPNLDRHEAIWEQHKKVAVTVRELLTQRIAIGSAPELYSEHDLLREVVSWEYPLHFGAFARDRVVETGWSWAPIGGFITGATSPVILENGLKRPQLPDWWDADYATELFAHIDHIAGNAESLYEWMKRNEVEPTEEHWECVSLNVDSYTSSIVANIRPMAFTGEPAVCAAWYSLWEEPTNRIPAWRTEEEQQTLTPTIVK